MTLARLEGKGPENSLLDRGGDSTGDAGDVFRGALFFGATAAEARREQSLEGPLTEEVPDLSMAK